MLYEIAQVRSGFKPWPRFLISEFAAAREVLVWTEWNADKAKITKKIPQTWVGQKTKHMSRYTIGTIFQSKQLRACGAEGHRLSLAPWHHHKESHTRDIIALLEGDQREGILCNGERKMFCWPNWNDAHPPKRSSKQQQPAAWWESTELMISLPL